MIRPAGTGLATAFYRLFLLDALAERPARPAALLARVSGERLPLSSGGFSRALHSLIESGYVVAAQEGAVALTPLGAAERMAERERWRAVIPAAGRLVAAEVTTAPPPAIAEARPVRHRSAPVAEAYLDRVLVAAIRERAALARDGGRPFALVLGVADVEASAEATRRAIVHRVIRGTLGGAATIFGGDASVYRYGDAGVAIVAPILSDGGRGAHLAALLRARMDELLHGMTTSVRAFSGARWGVRVGGASWSGEMARSGDVLHRAQDALERDEPLSSAA